MDRRYVGIDLHRRRSVIYAMDAQGDRLFCERITNDALRLLEVVSEAGEGAEVVIEATYGWYWAVDLLQDAGFSVHLAHPSGNDWGNRRVKNDERDARDLADLLRLGRLAEAWIAPPAVREARELATRCSSPWPNPLSNVDTVLGGWRQWCNPIIISARATAELGNWTAPRKRNNIRPRSSTSGKRGEFGSYTQRAIRSAIGRGSTMAQLVAFTLEDGSTVAVEVAQAPGSSSAGVSRGTRSAADDVTEKAATSFETRWIASRPIADPLITRMRAIEQSPDEIQVEFGMNLHAELGALIAAASTDANFKLSLTWNQQDPPKATVTPSGTASG